MNTATLHDQLPSPFGFAPLRRPNSIRRTTSIDMTWPEGRYQNMQFNAIGRDIFTGCNGEISVLNSDQFDAKIAQDRTILAIEATPPRETIEQLVGFKGGGYLREKLEQILPEEKLNGSPLYLMLDDLSGTSLIAGWAWSRQPGYEKTALEDMRRHREMRQQMENICTGFKTGSSALDENTGSSLNHRCSAVPALANPEDPDGWHAMPEQSTQVSMRRARRVDLWLDDVINIEVMFQDSASVPNSPNPERIAVHEYSIKMTADPVSQLIESITATPHVLPYPECPGAAANMYKLIDHSLENLRISVLEVLRRSMGCTHLNDALRSAAEAPQLLRLLNAQTKK